MNRFLNKQKVMTNFLLFFFGSCLLSTSVVLGSRNFQCPSSSSRRLDTDSDSVDFEPPKLDGRQYRRRAKRSRRRREPKKPSKKKFFSPKRSSKSTSKSDTCKSADDEDTLKCGAEFEGLDVRITLLGDWDCTGQLEPDQAAITLKDGAVLDCNGHTLRGDGQTGITGIVLMGDATVIGCEVADFVTGIRVVGDANTVLDSTIYGNLKGIVVESDGCNTIRETDTPANIGSGIIVSGTGILLLSDVSSIGNFFADPSVNVSGLEINSFGATTTTSRRRHLLHELNVDPTASLTVVVDDGTFSLTDGFGISTNGDKKLDLHLFGKIAVVDNFTDGLTLAATDGSTTTIHEQTTISRNGINGINLFSGGTVLFGEYAEASICDSGDDSHDISGDGSFVLEDDGVVVCSTSNATDIDGFECMADACLDAAKVGVKVCVK